MADNARVDELRKRLEKEPGSRLFAQLAEELRKEGDFAEAIAVCRAGLEKHATYWSARMTLGRALFDSGDAAAAVPEFEAVLKAAPDNILASRLLGESLESGGKLEAALARYKATLLLAPGDKQVQTHVADLQARLRAPALPSAGAGASSATSPILVVPPTLPAEESEASTLRARALASDAPIPLAAADESFELEQAYERGFPTEPMRVAPVQAPVEPPVIPPPVVEPPRQQAAVALPAVEPPEAILGMPAMAEEFEFEAPPLPPPAPRVELVPAVEVIPAREPEPESEPETVFAAQPTAVAEVPAEAAPELASSTLAELYFNQGHTGKAIDVYRQLVEREPANERARARLTELVALESHLAAEERRGVAEAPVDARAARRAAIERTIAKLEGLLVAVRRG